VQRPGTEKEEKEMEKKKKEDQNGGRWAPGRRPRGGPDRATTDEELSLVRPGARGVGAGLIAGEGHTDGPPLHPALLSLSTLWTLLRGRLLISLFFTTLIIV
jgi:hypothetical protein